VLLRKLEVDELLEKPHTYMKLKGPLRWVCFEAFAEGNSIKHYRAGSYVMWLKQTIVSETVSVSYNHDTQAFRKYINAHDTIYIYIYIYTQSEHKHTP